MYFSPWLILEQFEFTECIVAVWTDEMPTKSFNGLRAAAVYAGEARKAGAMVDIYSNGLSAGLLLKDEQLTAVIQYLASR